MLTIFHLHWLRESATAHLEADLGTTVSPDRLELAIIGVLPEQQPGQAECNFTTGQLLDALEMGTYPATLPTWAIRRLTVYFDGVPTAASMSTLQDLCNRIRDAASGLESAEVFLPYFTRRNWNDRFRALPAIQFERAGTQIVAVGVKPESLREIILRTAAAAYTAREPTLPVEFHYRGPMFAPWRNNLLDRYGLDVPEAAELTAMTFSMPGRHLLDWQRTPRERHCDFYLVFSRMALAIQIAARRWVLATFTAGLGNLANFDSGIDVLVYVATRPHSEKRTREFSYDVLDRELMDMAFGRTAKRLEPLLTTASEELSKAGLEEEAHAYRRGDIRLQAPKLTDRARRRSRVRSMLVAEGMIIDATIRFASRLKSINSPRTLNEAVDELVTVFGERVRKLFFFLPDPRDFEILMLLEAMNAFHCAMGGEQAVEIRASTADGGYYTSKRPISDSIGAI